LFYESEASIGYNEMTIHFFKLADLNCTSAKFPCISNEIVLEFNRTTLRETKQRHDKIHHLLSLVASSREHRIIKGEKRGRRLQTPLIIKGAKV